MHPYERLEAWRACDELALQVYKATRGFPKSELYGLTSQCRRAAISAAANIAEGSAKHGPREFARFLDIARGSLEELSYLLRISRDLEYLAVPAWEEVENLRDRAGALSWKLYQSIRRASRRITNKTAQ